MAANEQTKCRYVLTYELCGGDLLGCVGVYDNPDECFGKIFSMILDDLETRRQYERGETIIFPKMGFYHDDSNDEFYQVEVESESSIHENPDIYRVYYLREGDKEWE